MPNKRNSASRFSLPRCRMKRVLRHPLQKSSRERGPRRLSRGPGSPRENHPWSLIPSLAGPHSTHQGPSLKCKWGSLLLPQGAPNSAETLAESRFFPVPRFKAAAVQTEAKFLYKLAPVADAGAWVCEER